MRSWKERRPEVVTDPDRVAEHREQLDSEVRAYRLAEIRKERDLTQSEVADIIGVTQPNVSRLEAGALDTAGLSTLRAYVEALGGTVRITADFGDQQLLLQ